MATAPRTARAVARAELTQAILSSAARQLATTGPVALSVRAVARDLEMASSAVYRYFPSRDSLLSALIADAYAELADALEAAAGAVRRGDLRGRWRAVCHALRAWAIAHPHHYGLTYGTPVPGYQAPEGTVEPSRRVSRVVLLIMQDAQRAGITPVAGPTRVAAAEKAAIAPLLALVDPPVSAALGVRLITAWTGLFGHLSFELFGHLHRGVLDYDLHYATVVDQLAVDLGL